MEPMVQTASHSQSRWPLPILYDRMDASEAAVLRLLRGEIPDTTRALDSENLLSLILYHRVHPSIRDFLSQQSTPSAPWASELEQRLLECRLLETRTWNRKEAQAQRIGEAFASRGVDGLFVKGYALAKGIYPDPLQRAFGDIDIWVAPAEFTSASEALQSIGFRAQPLSRWSDPVEQTFLEEIKKGAAGQGDSPVEVDLHWAFTGRHGLQRFIRLDMAAIRERGKRLQPGMRFATVEDELVLEACHLVRSSFCPLSAYVDLRQLITKSPDWQMVSREADRAGVSTALHAGLTMSAALLGYELPQSVVSNRSWAFWQRALLLPRLAPEKIVRRDRLHEFGARFALKLLCQDRAALVLKSLALAPIGIAAKLTRGMKRRATFPQ